MHPNIERRFVELEVARGVLQIKQMAFASRFQFLFEALATDMKISRADLARRLGWDPFPDGGNLVSRGLAEPSPEDCYRLTEVYLTFTDTLKQRPRCEECGWPLAASAAEGCVAGNCSMRPKKGVSS